MERTSMETLRKKILKVWNDREKREEICEDFFQESEEGGQGETHCSCCGKSYKPGERRFRFQGTYSDFCDTCFCDQMEALIYREAGLDFDISGGGGTIWVRIEGEEPIFPGR